MCADASIDCFDIPYDTILGLDCSTIPAWTASSPLGTRPMSGSDSSNPIAIEQGRLMSAP